MHAFAYVIVLCLTARALHLFPILGFFNCFATVKVPITQQIVCWFSGLRGAIAVALAYQVVGPNAHVIRAATMFVVVGTTFVFGGSTKCVRSSELVQLQLLGMQLRSFAQQVPHRPHFPTP